MEIFIDFKAIYLFSQKIILMINDHNFHDVNVNVMIVIFWCEYHRVKSNQKYKCCRLKSAECRIRWNQSPG